MKKRVRNGGYLLTDHGRQILITWMRGISQFGEGTDPMPRHEHALASGLSRSTLQNLMRDRERGFRDVTVSQFCATIGKGIPQEKLFRLKRELRDSPATLAQTSLAVVDAIVDLSRFDVAGSMPVRLVSFSRGNRQQFLCDLEVIAPLVEVLRREQSASAQWTVANFELTRADQILLSDGKPVQSLNLARKWIDNAAIAAAKTSDRVLHATALLHQASILYSCGEFALAAGIRQQSHDLLDGVVDVKARKILRSRFAVDQAVQLSSGEQCDDAERWARQAMELTGDFDDAAWYSCASAVHGKLSLKRGDWQQAAHELESAVGSFDLCTSRKVPFQRVMFSNDLFVALSRCGDQAGAEEVRSSAERDCTRFGFEIERMKLMRSAIIGTFSDQSR